jgi:ABC-type transport system involved in multi-copper enzyme maturation permease subunit
MQRVICVAKNTFTEAIRDRVLYSLLLFAVLMIVSSLVIATISAQQYTKIVKDMGLTAISLIGIMISVFLGMGLVYKELERKTVYNIFSKPIRRYEFILGKFLGLAFTIFLITAAMGVILFLLVFYTESLHGSLTRFYYGGSHYPQLLIAIYFQYLEFLILISLALLFSSFTTPVMGVLFTFLTLTIGRFSSDVRVFAEEVKAPAASLLAHAVYRIIPHLDALNARAQAVYGGEIDWRLVVYATCYSLLYAVALICVSLVLFSKKEFK